MGEGPIRVAEHFVRGAPQLRTVAVSAGGMGVHRDASRRRTRRERSEGRRIDSSEISRLLKTKRLRRRRASYLSRRGARRGAYRPRFERAFKVQRSEYVVRYREQGIAKMRANDRLKVDRTGRRKEEDWRAAVARFGRFQAPQLAFF